MLAGLPMTLLEHTLPDGSHHLDWLLARSPDPAGRVVAFRLDARPDGTGSFRAQRLDDHRAFYLTHEGEVAGGRGWVRRVDAGVCVVREDQGRIDVRFRFDSSGVWLLACGWATGDGTDGDEAWWDFELVDSPGL